MSALEPATSNKHPIELSDREGKKAKTENPARSVTDLPMDVLKAVFALFSHRQQLQLAPVCKKFRAAVNAQRWTININHVASHLVTYMTHWRKVDTVITDCRFNEGGFQGDHEWGIEDVVGGVQRLYFATQLQARKIKITHAEPYGLEPYLKYRQSKPHLFSAATKAVHICLQAWDENVIGLSQIYFDLLWKATLGRLEFLSIDFDSKGDDAMQLSEEEKEEIDDLATKLINSNTRLNLHFDSDQHESYSTRFRQVMHDLPNVAIFVWQWESEKGIWSYTRYCQGKETVKTNLRIMKDPDFEAF